MAIRPKGIGYGFILRLYENGTVTETWQDPTAGYPLTTGAVHDPDGSLWVPSITADRLGQLTNP